jgi:hypothetical protein
VSYKHPIPHYQRTEHPTIPTVDEKDFLYGSGSMHSRLPEAFSAHMTSYGENDMTDNWMSSGSYTNSQRSGNGSRGSRIPSEEESWLNEEPAPIDPSFWFRPKKVIPAKEEKAEESDPELSD